MKTISYIGLILLLACSFTFGQTRSTESSKARPVGSKIVRRIVDAGGQVFNVKAYGAKGDGVTDDTPAFLTAFNAAVAAGGGTIYVPPTTSCYLFNSTL